MGISNYQELLMGVGISALGPGHASWIWTIPAQAEISLLQEMSPILAKSGSPEETEDLMCPSRLLQLSEGDGSYIFSDSQWTSFP